MLDNDVLVQISNLKTHFFTDEGVVKAVNGVDLTIEKGKMLCVVGESGCGKSITARSILQLIDKPGRIIDGEILLQKSDTEVIDIARLAPHSRQMRQIRRFDVGMIFQEH